MDYLESAPHRPFDAARLYPLEEGTDKPASAYRAARVFLLAYPIGVKRLVEYAGDTLIKLQCKYFTVITREQRRENGAALLYYRLFQEAVDTTARDMWIVIRFFQRADRIFAFYAAANTENELEEAGAIFQNLEFTE